VKRDHRGNAGRRAILVGTVMISTSQVENELQATYFVYPERHVDEEDEGLTLSFRLRSDQITEMGETIG
jgi:hypothetical protein